MSGTATWRGKSSAGGGEWAGLPVRFPHHMTCIHAQCGSPTAHAMTVTHIYRVPAPPHRPWSAAPGEGGSGGSAWGSWTPFSGRYQHSALSYPPKWAWSGQATGEMGPWVDEAVGEAGTPLVTTGVNFYELNLCSTD